jgi:hypothetical protein
MKVFYANQTNFKSMKQWAGTIMNDFLSPHMGLEPVRDKRQALA